MKAEKNGPGRFLCRILETRIKTRMLFLYIIGGALPMIFMGVYLVFGTNRILEEREKKAEMTELELLGSELKEVLNTVSTGSRRFYFDSQLEEIAQKNYTRYEELVEDYRAYSGFNDFGNLYNRLVVWVSIYLDNDTITENSNFRKADEEIKGQQWYQNAAGQKGGAVWQVLPLPLALDHSDTLVLTRLLRTRDSKDVGVLAMYLRRERLKEQVDSRSCNTRIVLNGEKEIVNNGESVEFSRIASHIKEWNEEGIFQKNVNLEGMEYVMTCYSFALGESDDILQMVSMKSYKDILRQASSQNRGSVLIFLGSVLLSVSLIFLFSWSFGGRVERFRKQMQRAAEGNFDLEPSLGGNDEISDLYGYLGTMISDIQRLLSEIYQERLHAEQLKTQQKEAEFKVLASQINPHFLYNTLETIRMKARVNHQTEIEELVKMLAKILRKNIQAGNQDVTIQAEAELVESYLKIQKYRFDERLQYRIQIDEEVKNCLILPLILQPIVENSIIHGLETKEGTGHIRIRIEKEEESRIRITVEDDGVGISKERLEEVHREMKRHSLNRSHIGVCNVHERIRLKYGEGYGLTIQSMEGKMTRVVMRLPVSF